MTEAGSVFYLKGLSSQLAARQAVAVINSLQAQRVSPKSLRYTKLYPPVCMRKHENDLSISRLTARENRRPVGE